MCIFVNCLLFLICITLNVYELLYHIFQTLVFFICLSQQILDKVPKLICANSSTPLGLLKACIEKGKKMKQLSFYTVCVKAKRFGGGGRLCETNNKRDILKTDQMAYYKAWKS